MNIIRINKIFLIFFLFFTYCNLPAQERYRPGSEYPFIFTADMSFGYGVKLNKDVIPAGNYTSTGFCGTFRVKCNTSKLFGFGIETGWLTISSNSQKDVLTEFGKTDIKCSLYSIPVLLFISLQKFGIQSYIGFGYYSLVSSSEVFNSKVISNEWDLGFMFGLGYEFNISKDFHTGTELKFNSITEVKDFIFSLQLKISYDMFRW